MIAIDLGKQQALDTNPKAIQEINFIGNLSGNNNILLFFIIEEVKETIIDFLHETVKVLWMPPYNLACRAHVSKVSDQKVSCLFQNFVLF